MPSLKPWILAVVLAAVAVPTYLLAGLLVVTLGIGNETRFRSSAFRLERANRILRAQARGSASSLREATAAILPFGAHDAGWSYETGDDSWLVAIGKLSWRDDSGQHAAQWVFIYGLDWRWREHFIEAAAMGGDAASLTPSLESRGAVYGTPAHLSEIRETAGCPQCLWY